MIRQANDIAHSNYTVRWAVIIGILLLSAHMAYLHYFYPYIVADDMFISLRYAERLLQGKGLTWNDGEHVEGYSNLLWILINAALGYLGANLEKAPQWLGVICTLLMPPLFAWHARDAKLRPWACFAAMVAFAVTAPVAVWALAGMETPLVMLLFGYVAILSYRLLEKPVFGHAWLIGAALALICLLRPEGPLYTLAVAFGLLAFSVVPLMPRLRMTAIICIVPFAVFMLQLAFRLDYYGQWFPNTVMAKVAFTHVRLESGFGYIVNAIFFFLPLMGYAMINFWNMRNQPAETQTMRYARFLLAVVAALSFAILLSGGDFFPCFRAFMPLLPLIIIMVMHGMTLGLKYAPVKKEWIFFGYVFACHLWLQYDIDTSQLPASSNWMLNAKEIGLELNKRYADQQPVIAVFAAGAIPYYAKLPALDVFGLNDTYLTTHRNEIGHFGQGVVGHELFDGRYIESKKPDILVFDIPGMHPICDSYPDECKNLLPHYREDRLAIPGHDVRIWLRKDSDKL